MGSDGAGNFPAGAVWEWTRSAYDPYPGWKPFDGAATEYNGKFMRRADGSCRAAASATRPGHGRIFFIAIFFSPQARWQFSGIRLLGGYMTARLLF